MEKTKVKTLVRQIRGVSYKPEDLHNELDDNSVVLLRANNIDEGKINFDDVVYVDKSKVSDEQYLKYRDILICASSGSKNLVGKAANIRFDMECTFGAFCKVVRPKEGFSDYLSVYFQSPIYRRKISEVAIGANINNIRNEHIDELDIPVFSNDEQASIVKKMYLIQEVISNRKAELEKLDNLIKARFVELFGNPIKNEKYWDTFRLGDCLKRIDNGKSFICKGRARIGEQPAILKLSAVTYGDYRPDENKALLDEKQFIDFAEIHEGDLLFTRKNTPELVGMAAYVHKTPAKLMMPDLIFRLVPNERMTAIFLWQLINNQEFRTIIQSIAGGSAKSMSNISKERLSNISVICPPINEQIKLNEIIFQVDKSKVGKLSTLL